MPSQKIPLFGGVPVPVPVTDEVDPPDPVTVFTPPDKNLARGGQAFYEVHLWMLQYAAFTDGKYVLSAVQDGGGGTGLPWSSETIGSGADLSTPIKILDGYPVRGNVTLQFQATTSVGGEIPPPPTGPALFGYYYRIGKGGEVEPERRYIGLGLGNDIDAGVPFFVAPDSSEVIHSFSSDRIDELSLAFSVPIGAPDQTLFLSFEDASDGLIAGAAVPRLIATMPKQANSVRDPQSVYAIKQVPFGGRSDLDHLRVAAPGAGGVFVHGFFTRRGP